METNPAAFTDPEFGQFSTVHQQTLTDKKVCYFAGYSYYPDYAGYTYYYLAAIARAGFEIVFISSSRLSSASIVRLKEYCAIIIEKENKGTDFGAWRVALSLTQYGEGFQCLLLANDSVFGPLHDIGIVSDTFMHSEYDFYGLTLSYQRAIHLQSFFLLFRQNILRSQPWKEFWQNMVLYTDKNDVVVKYEIGLTSILHHSGFRYGMWCKWHEVATAESVRKKLLKDETLFQYWYRSFLHSGAGFNKQINPCSFYWKELIEEHMFPFLKKELIQHHNLNLCYGVFDRWKAVIHRNSAYDGGLITEIIVLNQLKEEIHKNFPAEAFECYLQNPDKDEKGWFHHLACLLPARQTALETDTHVALVIVETASQKEYVFRFAYLDEPAIDRLIDHREELNALFPHLDGNHIMLLYPYSGEVIPYLQGMANESMLVVKPAPHPELALVEAVHHFLQGRNTRHLVHGSYNLVDISDISESMRSVAGYRTDAHLKTEEEVFDEIFTRYQETYECLPAWYKHMGQIIKIIQGNKLIKYRFQHKHPPKSPRKLDELINWYHYEYDVLPEWYKKIGKKLKKTT